MRYYQFLFLVALLICSCSSNTNNKKNSLELDARGIEELEKKGMEAFANNKNEAVKIFKEVAFEYERIGKVKKAGIANLNIANIYDEGLNKIDSALLFATKSMQIWIAQKDTLQMANLRKYVGLLKGKLGRYAEAKKDIQTAIDLYRQQNFNQGIAVSEFNMADMYFRAKDYDNSIKYLKSSTDFWVSINELSRIYTQNILGMRINDAIDHKDEVARLINENKIIEQKTSINSYNKAAFEKLVIEIQRKRGE